MAPRKMDKSRLKEAGQISPPLNGAQYELDGEYYDGQFNHMVKGSDGLPARHQPHRGDAPRPAGDEDDEAPANLHRSRRATTKRVSRRPKSPAHADAAAEAAEAPTVAPVGKATKPGVKPGKAEAAKPAADGPIDLGAWARGEQKYPFAQVRKVVQERLNVVAQNEERAVEAMIDQKLIEAKDVKVVDMKNFKGSVDRNAGKGTEA